MINNLLIAVHAFASHILKSFSVDEMLLLRYVNLSTNFREPPFNVEMSAFLIKTHVLYFVCIHIEVNATCSRLCSRDLAWVVVFTRSTVIYIVYLHSSLCGVSSASCHF